MKSLLISLSAAVVTSLSSFAAAATVSFTPQNSYDAAQISGAVGGTYLTVTAATFDVQSYNSWTRAGQGDIDLFGKSQQAKLSLSAYGMALENSPHDNSHQIEGKGWNDAVVFAFDHLVTLNWASFNFVDHNDDYVLFAGDSVQSLESFSMHSILANADPSIQTGINAIDRGIRNVGIGVMARVFAIGAKGDYDNFKILGLNFDRVPTDPHDPVPLPAGLPLMATGIALLSYARSRK
ncbi:MAG: VPLPA-CTERM sorting domain-containing protein, partial [Pseudomonadota bacterium]